MTDNLFDNNNEPVIDLNKDFFSEWVGEGKKYKTPQDLARGKYEADITIKNRESEMEQLREEYKKLYEEHMAATKLEELIDRAQRQPLASHEQTLNVNEVKQSAFDPKEIESLVSSKISEYETSKKYKENFDFVSQKVKEHYGENHKQVLKSQMESMGLSEDYVNNLARTAPQAFLKLFEVGPRKTNENFQTPPRSSQRNDSFAPSTNKRTWSYYEELRKKDPVLYLNPKTQKQMMDDAKELGDDFQDGDFKRFPYRFGI